MSSHTSATEAHTSSSRLVNCLSCYFYVVVVGIALIVVGIVAPTGVYPRHTPGSLLAVDVLRYTPLLLTVGLLMVFRALLLPWILAKREARTTGAKLDYRYHFTPLLCSGLGYTSLLLGIVSTCLGSVTLLLFGILIDNCWERQGNLLQTLRARSFRPLTLCATLCTLYTVIVTLTWPSSRERALDYWDKEVWLFLVPLCSLTYSGPSQQLLWSFWLGALRIGWIYIVAAFTFFCALLINCGSNLLTTLTLSKDHLHDTGFVINTAHMLIPFTFTHYIYIGIFLLTPIVATIRSSSHSLCFQTEYLLLGVILHTYALQARYLLFMVLLLVAYAVACKLLDWVKSTRRQPYLMSYLTFTGVTLVPLVYTMSPHLTVGYLEEGVRNELLQMSYQALREIPIQIGGGLDYTYNPLLSSPVNTEQESIIVQFHNQYMQMLVQSGIVGLLLWIPILGPMFQIARRQHNVVPVVLTSLQIILCDVDLLNFIHRYVVGVMFLLCLAPSTQGGDKFQRAD